jgi:hypothetical protein
MAIFRDLIGRRFGKLTVVARATNDSHGNAHWHCMCECGGGRRVRSDNLLRARVRRCLGCSAPAIHIGTWYHADAQGTAGFALATRDGAALLVPRWVEAPRLRGNRQPAPLLDCVQQLMQVGIVRVNDQSVAGAHAWLRRHRQAVTYHAYHDAQALRQWWQKWNAHGQAQS